MKTYKLRVYPSQVETTLNLIIDLGYGENIDTESLSDYRCEFIFAVDDGCITMGWNENQFLDSNFEEITVDQLKDIVAAFQAKPDPFLKEYLTPDFRLMLASSHQNGWLKVPEGADTAVLWDEGEPFQAILFHSGRNKFYSPLHNQWMSCTDWQSDEIESSRKVVWQRDPQPEPETTSLEDSDSLLDVVYHYSASFNGARGTVSYDGVITFPGRITGIEDYRKVRAEIAKNGNVTPDQVNVHSLTIVG